MVGAGENTKTLLTTSKSYNPAVRLGKIKSDKGEVDDNLNTQDKAFLALKTVKLTDLEQAFIREYRELEELEREKGVKFFRCIGDEPHTEQFTEGIEEKRSTTVADIQ